MIKADEIEEALGEAVEIKFNVAFMKDSENCVVLTFKNPQPILDIYDLLVKRSDSQMFTLVIYRKENHIDLSIIDEQTSDIINIKDLFFQPDSLDTFLRHVPNNLPLAFIIADFNSATYMPDRKVFFSKYIMMQ